MGTWEKKAMGNLPEQEVGFGTAEYGGTIRLDPNKKYEYRAYIVVKDKNGEEREGVGNTIYEINSGVEGGKPYCFGDAYVQQCYVEVCGIYPKYNGLYEPDSDRCTIKTKVSGSSSSYAEPTGLKKTAESTDDGLKICYEIPISKYNTKYEYMFYGKYKGNGNGRVEGLEIKSIGYDFTTKIRPSFSFDLGGYCGENINLKTIEKRIPQSNEIYYVYGVDLCNLKITNFEDVKHCTIKYSYDYLSVGDDNKRTGNGYKALFRNGTSLTYRNQNGHEVNYITTKGLINYIDIEIGKKDILGNILILTLEYYIEVEDSCNVIHESSEKKLKFNQLDN